MTASIIRLSGVDAYDLISPQYFLKMSSIDQETMHRIMTNSSRVWLGADEDKIIASWGLVPPTLMSDVAYLWLYTTPHLQHYVFTFIRHSQRAVEEMLREFPTIVGHTRYDNHRALQWLRWLGAKYGDPQGDFLPFTIEASQWQQPVSAQSA